MACGEGYHEPVSMKRTCQLKVENVTTTLFQEITIYRHLSLKIVIWDISEH